MRLKLVAVVLAWSAVTLAASARAGCVAGGTVVAVQPLLVASVLPPGYCVR
jgi:hypothetical protein